MEEKEQSPSDLTDEQWEEIAPLYRNAQLHVEQAEVDGRAQSNGLLGIRTA